MARQTLRRRGAGQTIVVLTCARSGTRAIGALALRIGAEDDVSTSSAGAAALFGCRACLACSLAGRIATDGVDAIARYALRGKRASRPIRLSRLRLIACARAVAFAGIAFVVRIGRIRDAAAFATVSTAFLRYGTRLAGAHAGTVATYTVNAMIGNAFARGQACQAIAVPTSAVSIARPTIAAFLIGIGPRRNDSTCSIGTAAFLDCGAGHARRRAIRVATNAVDAMAGSAACIHRARGPIGL